MSAPSRRPWPPSSSLLSLLASIASSLPSTASTPTPSIPPSFLCPSLSQLPHPQPFSLRALPDRFEQGDDGFWRKDDVYTLYGSTICPTCEETAVVEDNQIQPQSDASNPPPSNPPALFDINSLPPGWKPGGTIVKRTSLIIILSVALTSLICISLIVSLLLKRARSKRSLSNVDLEKELKKRKRKIPPDDSKNMEGKTVQKLWTRATARWKANARYIARQRRGRRGIVRSQLNTSTTSLSRQETASASSPAPPSPSALPPAYHYDTPDACPAASDPHSQPSSSHSPYHLPHLAHVATDDKAVLAQMVDLVSAPLPDSNATISGGSVPAWPDSEEEEFVSDNADTPSADESSESIFPSPPSKGKMSDSYFDFPYTLHAFEAIGSDPGPSAPPFAEADNLPSAPIAHDPSQMEASAPDWDDDLLHDAYIDEERQSPRDSFTPGSTPPPVHVPVIRPRRPPSYHP